MSVKVNPVTRRIEQDVQDKRDIFPCGRLILNVLSILFDEVGNYSRFDMMVDIETCGKQLARFIHYLETQPNVRRIREEGVSYDVQP